MGEHGAAPRRGPVPIDLDPPCSLLRRPSEAFHSTAVIRLGPPGQRADRLRPGPGERVRHASPNFPGSGVTLKLGRTGRGVGVGMWSYRPGCTKRHTAAAEAEAVQPGPW
ncbi:hypothetical protein RHA1_ro08128 (plasmid) [Rhodococcus jostii RHA1]|uniref:Uncharacterized protein n=1 Tax=Rhodococcus jostii (strain RHA1) TaxID=101510 RepID=Q0RZW1_RHOJR|nr:hypothetical protein RHA1_ro08128 [Rhodococcus jostii RHA1]